ncbi:MAG: hypothetical protein A3F74_13250 [Betaproteobacteria bacterium RIFCSPLOWO2_12_FULL_62_58]|nr:MAG: hypothetical protein A3F74_13250 [Betaproteobacteria bacterium RIFCSPLOWO2_12_FULL_62_58]
MAARSKALISALQIEQSILLLRGHRVLLDSTLAGLYGVQTKVLVQAVKRNRERFPSDFLFELNKQEVTNLRSQIVTSSWGGRRYSPFAFTEQGVAMLSSVLNSPQAIRVNIEIMRAFVRLRAMIATNEELSGKLDELERKVATHDQAIAGLITAIRELAAPPPPKQKRRIGFVIDQ